MRVLFLSAEGDGLGVAHRLSMQGNEVFFWFRDARSGDRSGDGMIRRVPAWRPYLSKTDLVITDMIGLGKLEPIFQKMRIPYLCCSEVIDQIELDRAKGMQLFKLCGVQIPPTRSFPSPNEAKKWLATEKAKEWGSGVVLKPHENQSTSKTMAVKDPEVLPWALGLMPSGPITIQDVIEGVEVSTEAWFNGRDFIRPFNHTFEEKKFLTGNLGYNTGCMGNVVLAAESNKLTQHTVERLKKFLSTISYKGPVDINCIVNERGAFALEPTPRFGYDAIEALLEGLKEPAINLFFETAVGKKTEMQITRDTMIAVRLSVPPWPMAKPKAEDRDEPILGINDQNLKHLFLTDVYYDREDKLYKAAGGDGVLLKATAIGRVKGEDYTSEAQSRVYRTLDRIRVSGKQYRTDIGDRVNGDVAKLKGWGWLS